MLMTTLEIGGCSVRLHGSLACPDWIVQLSGAHETEALGQQVAAMDALTGRACCLIVVTVGDWNRDLSPWPAPPVFGSEAFSGCAEATLEALLQTVLPDLIERAGAAPERCLVAGYSLAGLFALWAATRTDRFTGVLAASPSVWYPGWLAYEAEHPIQAAHVYLSLGDKEPRTRHPVMRTVGDCIQAQLAQLRGRGTHAVLQWEAGNHFADHDMRMAKGVTWLLAQTD